MLRSVAVIFVMSPVDNSSLINIHHDIKIFRPQVGMAILNQIYPMLRVSVQPQSIQVFNEGYTDKSNDRLSNIRLRGFESRFRKCGIAKWLSNVKVQVRILLPNHNWNRIRVVQWIRDPSKKKRYFKFLKTTSVVKSHLAQGK